MPFWRTQKDQLDKEGKTLKGPERDYALLAADFAKLRYEWANAVIDATKNNDPGRTADALRLMVETDTVNARIERIEIRARMDHRPRALAASPLVARIRALFNGYRWTCVSAPPAVAWPVAHPEDKSDGPAMRRAIGCRAQQWFMAGDYERLES